MTPSRLSVLVGKREAKPRQLEDHQLGVNLDISTSVSGWRNLKLFQITSFSLLSAKFMTFIFPLQIQRAPTKAKLSQLPQV